VNQKTKKTAFNKPEKAYKNLDFLNSRDARTLRILAEYLHPKAQFLSQGLQNTIVVFGSARAPAPEDIEQIKAANPNDPRLKLTSYYEQTVELTNRLTQWSLGLDAEEQPFVVCTGAGPGVMMAANRGAHEAGGKNAGLAISLPNESVFNPYVTPELYFEFHYFFTRKFWFAYLAKALIIMPGGFGTLDELFEVLTLIQTKKIERPLPIVLFGKEFWNKLINFETLVEFGTISPEDLSLLHLSDQVEDAFQFITSNLKVAR
tara:strand:+ start:1862 stop:2644 length:783 start_codon:yes stop_codon:yes gene_type:complete